MADQRRRLLCRAEAGELYRQTSGVQRHRPYTRRGDFQPDKDGYLVNGAGYYLMGIPVDPTTGNLVGQCSAAAAVPERLSAGAADDEDRLSRQPRELSVDANARHQCSRLGTAQSANFIANPLAVPPAAAKSSARERRCLLMRRDRHRQPMLLPASHGEWRHASRSTVSRQPDRRA